MIILDKDGITAVRYQYGIRPFVLGKISNGNYAVADVSEIFENSIQNTIKETV